MTDATTPTTRPADTAGPLRRLLLALIVFGTVGLLAELLLLEHWEPGWQLTPLVLLTTLLVLATLALRRPSAALVRAMRTVGIVCVLAGALGAWVHLDDNVGSERRRNPELAGNALLWEGVRGRAPLLAPGALLQLGLVGLLFAYRHPAVRR